MSTNNMAQLYDTLLSIPGMNDTVKLDLKISRQQVLLLTQVIALGLKQQTVEPGGMLSVASKESLVVLNQIIEDCLEKAGLTQLSAKLHLLEQK